MKRPELVPARGRLTETPVTGDWVGLDDGGAIAAVFERHGAIVRRAPGDVTAGHVLAANVDLALVTEPLPDPKARRLERFAALAASGGVPTALVRPRPTWPRTAGRPPRGSAAGSASPTRSRSAR